MKSVYFKKSEIFSNLGSIDILFSNILIFQRTIKLNLNKINKLEKFRKIFKIFFKISKSNYLIEKLNLKIWTKDSSKYKRKYASKLSSNLSES